MRAIYLLLCLSIVSTQVSAQTQPKPLAHVKGKSNLPAYLNERTWNALFPHRYHVPSEDFYSWKAFLQATEKFPHFLAEGSTETRKRELCAFLANIAQETSGGWAGAPGGYYKWGLYFVSEQGCEHGCPVYSDTNNKAYPPAIGKSYHGRGPKQLSWNYNYGQFSLAYYGSKDTLLQDPGILATDPVVSFSSALWFWMTPQAPKPSCHDIMTGKWVPTASDTLHGRMPGFGATVNVINGGVECGRPGAEKTLHRYEYYRYFCKYFHVSPGDNVACTTQQPFNQ